MEAKVVHDTGGEADIAFPQISRLPLEGLDLRVAVLAVDPITGLAIDSSTSVTILLRDTGICR